MAQGHLTCLKPWMLLVCVLALCGDADAFFEWMKKATPAPASVPPAVPTPPTAVQRDAPPFEMSVADEKVLAEAKLMDMSPLDGCHFRVSTNLRYPIQAGSCMTSGWTV